MSERKALFIPEGEAVPELCLCVDGLIPGTCATYSHWEGAESPAVLSHDLSTGILIKAARDPDTYLRPFAVVANNHVDTDGILSMALALDPSLVEFEQLLIDAAYYGDFNYFRSEAGARFALRLHQAIAEIRDLGGAWEQACFDDIIPRLRDLIEESRLPDPDRDAQINQIETVIESIKQGQVRHTDHGSFCVFQVDEQHGHHANDLCSVFVPDDLPLWSLNAYAAPHQYILLVLKVGEAFRYQLLAPTHSWAQTVDLPDLSWPDVTKQTEALQSMEQGDAQWVSLPRSREFDFTCLLTAQATDKQASVAVSTIPLDEMIKQMAECLG